MIKFLNLFAISFVLVACTKNISPNAYSAGSVGQVNRTISAVVISAREIDVTGSNALGASAGAVAGGAGGSMLGGGNVAGGIVGAVGGAVVGGLVGAAIESNVTQQKGMEYVVETENGNLMTLAQGDDTIFTVNQRVLVLYGSPSRLIADPRAKK